MSDQLKLAVVRKIRSTPMTLSMIGRGKAGADAEGHVRIALSKVTEVSHTDAKANWMFAKSSEVKSAK